MSTERGLYRKPLGQWTEQERQVVREKYEACGRQLEEIVSTAEEEGKGIFVKDHTGFFAEPVSMERLSLIGMREDLVSEDHGSTDKVHEAKSMGEDEGQEAGQQWKLTMPTPSEVGTEQVPPPSPYDPLNTTPLPDAYLITWTPTFLLRHPCLAYPSYRRAAPTATLHKLAPGCTLKYTRSLYEFFASHHPQSSPSPPIILAASDIVHPTLGPALLSHYCDLVGLDASQLKYTWSVATKEELEKMPDVAVTMTKSLQASSGVLAEKGGDEAVDLETEVGKWTQEFGEDEAAVLEKWCKESLEDWEWLFERRLKVLDVGV